ncbi:MAG: molybdopterin dinucleotide binding domain-containing protein, partial [Gemmatimonadales bacterium]
CWPDWMIAVELAERLGADLGATSVGELWDEIERTAPSYTGITRAVLDGPARRDGVVAPLAAAAVGLPRARSPRPIDPMATPGIEAVERQGAAPRAGQAEMPGTDDTAAAPSRPSASKPPLLAGVPATEAPSVPARDAYSLRLAATRRLYDDGALVEASGALAALVPVAAARVHHAELERLGVPSGGQVRLRSARGSVTLEALADDRVPQGVVHIFFNVEGGDSAGASALVDAAAAVTDVRLETP